MNDKDLFEFFPFDSYVDFEEALHNAPSREDTRREVELKMLDINDFNAWLAKEEEKLKKEEEKLKKEEEKLKNEEEKLKNEEWNHRYMMNSYHCFVCVQKNPLNHSRIRG